VVGNRRKARSAHRAESTCGCAYYGRCPVADKALGCDQFRNMLLETEPDHFVACFRHSEE
jgi:hypothetical protein